MSQKLVVALKPLHSCLVNLPRRWTTALSSQPLTKGCLVFRLTWASASEQSGSASAYVAWAGGESRTPEHRDHSGVLSTNVLELDSTLAQHLGVADGATVAVEHVGQAEVCTQVAVEPMAVDDWEVLELNAGAVEQGLLAQARVVAVGQPVVFWLNPSTHVRLVPSAITPTAPVAVLDNDTEVAVAPRVRRQPTHAAEGSEGGGRGDRTVCCLRLAAAEDVEPHVVYVHEASRAARLGPVARVGHGLPDAQADQGTPRTAPWLARILPSEHVQPGVLLAAPSTLQLAGYCAGELVRVTRPGNPAIAPRALVLHGSADVDLIRRALEQMLERQPQLVVGVGGWVAGARVASFAAAAVDSKDKEDGAGFSGCVETPLSITRESLAALEILADDAGPAEPPCAHGAAAAADELAGISEFLADAWRSVEGALRCGGGGLLVCGRRGSGKTSVAQWLSRQATAQRSQLVHCRHVDCAQLALDPSTQAVRDALRSTVDTLRLSAPGLLVLDDMDALLPAEGENDQGGGRRVRVLVDALVEMLGRDGRVAVVATAGGRAQVHAGVFSAGVFARVVEIPAPGKAARERVLAAVAGRSSTPARTGFGLAAYGTEGFLPGDLCALYARAAQEAAMRVLSAGHASDASAVFVTAADLSRALHGFKPLALRSIKTQSSATRWADIGGLADTRRQLRETLELPTKYAAIFATSPLRLRSGVLLYGFPGCGKTLLASAVASECGLNFIATKGPELLSKYIGSSEQAVRDLFARAVAAAPCVLFFDEFDAIAPRRGHDNTGVTDRVVNQFLTEMDGAEGLHGVYVLAATSRPDLIDPALLRPGRLDKAFLCPMPDMAERQEILEKHAAKLHVHPSVDWAGIARATERFTGADLQALVYNAFLEAVHERVDNAAASAEGTAAGGGLSEDVGVVFEVIAEARGALSGVQRAQVAERLARLVGGCNMGRRREAGQKDEDAGAQVPVVTGAHFAAALRATQSSLADSDRERFAAIYRAFVDDKKSTTDKPRKPIEQRATMA
ncbi:Peroxisome biosynthesis protein pex1 [Coemansia interrupta]|uniref:Peroxisomal ATPase PEX1 n=1 Tax=Coemansia interrupta TaxID=1126814 RepID=A0A9W8HIL2_9FUNG|nr:Peroxisome biosynthesis protein pex1 [Coemansia interrupta]